MRRESKPASFAEALVVGGNNRRLVGLSALTWLAAAALALAVVASAGAQDAHQRPNAPIAQATVMATVRFDNLTRRYYVTRLEDGRLERSDTVDREDRVRARRRLALELGNVGRRQHGADAGQRARFAHVDPDDSCVRVRAAQQLGVEQAARRDIRHVLHAARDFLRPIRPRDRQPNTSHVARRLHHAHRDTPWCAASLIAATIFV